MVAVVEGSLSRIERWFSATLHCLGGPVPYHRKMTGQQLDRLVAKSDHHFTTHHHEQNPSWKRRKSLSVKDEVESLFVDSAFLEKVGSGLALFFRGLCLGPRGLEVVCDGSLVPRVGASRGFSHSSSAKQSQPSMSETCKKVHTALILWFVVHFQF